VSASSGRIDSSRGSRRGVPRRGNSAARLALVGRDGGFDLGIASGLAPMEASTALIAPSVVSCHLWKTSS
jgi:hypothetical protein